MGPFTDGTVLSFLDLLERVPAECRTDLLAVTLGAFRDGETFEVRQRVAEYCEVDVEARRWASGTFVDESLPAAVEVVVRALVLMREVSGHRPATAAELGEALVELGLSDGPAIAEKVWDHDDVLARRCVLRDAVVPLGEAIESAS